MNIALRAFWSNQPMPIQEKIKQPDCMIDLSLGNVLTLTTGVRSINNKMGDVALNAIDVGADLVGSARHVFDELSPKVDALIDNKLDKVDYVQHFRGLFSSYSALKLALKTALDGDYAHIDSGLNFGRLCAIWDGDDQEWRIIEANVALNTDEMPEGSTNLYFKSERVRQTALAGLSNQVASEILSTDSVLIALAKLQAQLKVKPVEAVWVSATDVLNAMPTAITPYVTVHGKQAKLEFLKANGMLYIRGGFTVTEVISQPILGTLKAGYKLKFTITPTTAEQNVKWMRAFTTVTGILCVLSSNPVDKMIDEHLVTQELKSPTGFSVGNYHVFGCLGAVLD